MADKLEKWLVAKKKFRLSDMHIQMARELGLNPEKFGKLDNHKQEPWKAPLKDFIEDIYRNRFRKPEPDTIKTVEELILEKKNKKEERKNLTQSKEGN